MRTVMPKNALIIPPHAERVFKGIIFDVYQWQQTMYDGSIATFERLKRPDTVQIIAVKDDKVVVLEQEQPDQPTAFYDIPSGRHDNSSEDELAAAQRELREETGMTFKAWRLLAVKQPHAKIDWLVYTFLATDFDTQVKAQPDSGERIKVELLSFSEAKQRLSSAKARFTVNEIAQVETLQGLLALPAYSDA